MKIPVHLGDRSYEILLQRGVLSQAGACLNLARKVLIVTDDGVPELYAKTLAAQAKEAHICVIPQGEQSKNLQQYAALLQAMTDRHFTRGDCVAAVGGGVVGDLAGFAAATYMRGVDFYQLPTTLLAQIDSSIGGKTAVDFAGYKNIVGAFHQPKAVLIDPNVLQTLSARQVANGLAEAVKMALTSDASLFEALEAGLAEQQIEAVIARSLAIKKKVVEEDEREAGLRKILNFGHTLGHGIESAMEGRLLHGECVALGMQPVCAEEVRSRLVALCKKFSLPTTVSFDRKKAEQAILHDKKSTAGGITLVQVEQIGSCHMEEKSVGDVLSLLDAWEGEV